ncbi:hypothetical protein EVAR_12233_1 [Eumeta japonica]|uniref:Uncharacterized protein n=1 Tax=Eumeta variegata TaxID=151549 RepID=A0A4C1UH00_EUMVA|nr:hypothetical protein EVAR_12233_1 [Eumeta japonica]
MARLPPTEEAAIQHVYRAYHQVQNWLGVDKNLTNWGWTSNEQGLFPVTYLKDTAPQTLLKFVSCMCCKECNGRGRKVPENRAKCSGICCFSLSKSCQNITTIEIETPTAKNISSLLGMFSQ